MNPEPAFHSIVCEEITDFKKLSRSLFKYPLHSPHPGYRSKQTTMLVTIRFKFPNINDYCFKKVHRTLLTAVMYNLMRLNVLWILHVVERED